MMTDFVLRNTGLLEVILGTEMVILLTAGFFYQIAKIIARSDRHDPLVRFYRVFWTAFVMPVTSIKDLDLRQAEFAARSAGVVGLGGVSVETLSRQDAPDLVDLESAATNAPDLGALDDAEASPPPSRVQAIGRTGGENDALLRGRPNAGPSRERQFADRNKAAQNAPPPPSKPMSLDDDEPIHIEADDDEPAAPTHRPAPATRAPVPSPPVPATASSATGTFDVCITPFAQQPRIVGQRAGEVYVDVTCAPEDGQANGVIIQLMADQLGVRPYQIVLLRGHYKVRKTLQVAGVDQQVLDAKLSRLHAL